MLKSDSLKIFQKTGHVLQKSIIAIQTIIHRAEDVKFKMMLVDSLEILKERCDMIERKLKELQLDNAQTSVKQTPTMAEAPSLELPMTLSDKQIAHVLFDICNETVKKIYTYLNHYKGIDKKVGKLIKEAVKAIERLREHLAEYL